jgi:hypothetical protein
VQRPLLAKLIIDALHKSSEGRQTHGQGDARAANEDRVAFLLKGDKFIWNVWPVGKQAHFRSIWATGISTNIQAGLLCSI